MPPEQAFCHAKNIIKGKLPENMQNRMLKSYDTKTSIYSRKRCYKR